MKHISDNNKQIFSDLTQKALSEEKGEAFIECLTAREPYLAEMINTRTALETEEAHELLNKEKMIFQRLQEERTRVLKAMEQLSKERKATRAYGSGFPLPTISIYFDKTE